jgi:hypothetical protein
VFEITSRMPIVLVLFSMLKCVFVLKYQWYVRHYGMCSLECMRSKWVNPRICAESVHSPKYMCLKQRVQLQSCSQYVRRSNAHSYSYCIRNTNFVWSVHDGMCSLGCWNCFHAAPKLLQHTSIVHCGGTSTRPFATL